MMRDEHLIETCAVSKSVFEGKILHVFVDDINLPNGEKGFREYIKHIGAVAVLPLTDDGKVICVRQYRYAVGQVTVEIPAGKLDPGETDHLEAAKRELREETGYTIHSYISEKRLLLAQQLLQRGYSLANAAEECGYQDYSTFSRAYKKRFGRSPSEK